MTYETFRENLTRELKAYLPRVYEDWNLELREVPKVNGYVDGLHLLPSHDTGESPTIYVQDLYAYYQKCGNLEQVYRKAASIFVMGIDYATYLNEVVSVDLPKEQVVFCLIPADGNERLLQNVPHRKTLDMALIYRIMLHSEDGGFNSTIITNELAEMMGLSEEELYQLAEVNTPAILPAKVHYCDDCFAILTNQYKLMGATVMLYPGVLKEAAERLGDDLFILPSSIHEVFLLPSVGQSISDMNRMVVEANNTVVPPEEVLAQHVFFYDRERDAVGIPVELPDGIDD